MWHGAEGMGWWMLWGGLMMFVFWGGIVALVIWAVQSLSGHEARHDRRSEAGAPTRTPLDILKERYARGDIGRDEFARISRDLESS